MNFDTSLVAVYSKETGIYDFGNSIESSRSEAGELRDPVNIPFHLSVDRRNVSDVIQFVKVVDDI